MDSKISILFLGILFCLTGCQENNWMDWKAQNELWLENNKNQPGVVTSSSGLQYKIVADPLAGYGEATPNRTSTIVCDYTVRLINGYKVDAANSQPITLSGVIAGFSEGCTKIHSNGDIEIYIPAYLGYDAEKYNSGDYYHAEGYGTEGTQSYIPPYSTLIYEVHICSIVGN
ncbi:MAG: FKBP-type peptidyl-prolyl cis-trans isomerase [Paludibacteraceae bacterium]|nr:FKBP-type peptidyl-prolyl cis-trans isomerase [Paludibacteraceae bacterium]